MANVSPDYLTTHNCDQDSCVLDESDDVTSVSNCAYIDDLALASFISSKTTVRSSKLNHLSLLHCNCRSLKASFDNIQILINDLPYPISCLAVTETWLTLHNQDSYLLPGYHFVSQPRIDKRGGGVGLFIDQSLEFTIRTELSVTCPDIESIFVEISQSGRRNVLVGCIYRPPDSCFSTFITSIVQFLKIIDHDDRCKTVLIAGDFNLDLLNNLHTNSNDFLNTMLSYSYRPTIDKPTRITTTSSTLIDNIFIRCFNLALKSAIIWTDISDHLPVILCTNNIITPALAHPNKTRLYNENSIVKFAADLNSNNLWDSVFSTLKTDTNTNAAMTAFTKIFSIKFESYFPERVIKSSHRLTPRQVWMTKSLLKSCNKKAALFRKYRKTTTEPAKTTAKLQYTTYFNALRKLLKTAEKKLLS